MMFYVVHHAIFYIRDTGANHHGAWLAVRGRKKDRIRHLFQPRSTRVMRYKSL
jgi:hypothetical protein